MVCSISHLAAKEHIGNTFSPHLLITTFRYINALKLSCDYTMKMSSLTINEQKSHFMRNHLFEQIFFRRASSVE